MKYSGYILLILMVGAGVFVVLMTFQRARLYARTAVTYTQMLVPTRYVCHHCSFVWLQVSCDLHLQKGYCQGDEYLAELDYIGGCIWGSHDLNMCTITQLTEVMERHKEGYESEMEVSSVDYLSDEFTMQSSDDDEPTDYNNSTQQQSVQQVVYYCMVKNSSCMLMVYDRVVKLCTMKILN